ncbi:MAG: hypothetical protein WCK65_10280 [Rhodospirillaceae bacterium]
MTSASLEFDTYLRFTLALVVVLGLIVCAGWITRRLAAKGMLPVGLLSTRPGRSQRLSVVEVKQLDVRRRLVLVRRDQVEHLLLLGAAVDLVIETGIVVPPATIPNCAGIIPPQESLP